MNNRESIYPNSGGPADPQDDGTENNNDEAADQEESKQMTLKSCLDDLESSQGFVDALVGNLSRYCEAVAQKAAADANSVRESDRSKLFVVSPKQSHKDEIDERLSFLQEFALNSSF